MIRTKFQIWRLFTPIFLHVGFNHMVFNITSTLVFGSLLEQMIGFKQMAAVYFISGIGGNLFSSMMSDLSSVGASTSVFGILSGQVAMVVVNWQAFSANE